MRYFHVDLLPLSSQHYAAAIEDIDSAVGGAGYAAAREVVAVGGGGGGGDGLEARGDAALLEIPDGGSPILRFEDDGGEGVGIGVPTICACGFNDGYTLGALVGGDFNGHPRGACLVGCAVGIDGGIGGGGGHVGIAVVGSFSGARFKI